MKANLKFILILIIVFVLGLGVSWIFNTRKPQIQVDKHFVENQKFQFKIDSVGNLILGQDQKYSDLESRISKTDSLIKSNNKKGNDSKNNFHRSNLSLWNDSVLRANNITK